MCVDCCAGSGCANSLNCLLSLNIQPTLLKTISQKLQNMLSKEFSCKVIEYGSVLHANTYKRQKMRISERLEAHE